MKLAIAAQAADFATLAVALRLGATERNPLVLALLLAGGIPALALAKVALVSLMVALRPVLADRWTLVRNALVAVGAIGTASNVLAVVGR